MSRCSSPVYRQNQWRDSFLPWCPFFPSLHSHSLSVSSIRLLGRPSGRICSLYESLCSSSGLLPQQMCQIHCCNAEKEYVSRSPVSLTKVKLCTILWVWKGGGASVWISRCHGRTQTKWRTVRWTCFRRKTEAAYFLKWQNIVKHAILFVIWLFRKAISQ